MSRDVFLTQLFPVLFMLMFSSVYVARIPCVRFFFAAEKRRYIKYDRSHMSTNDVAGLM